MNRNKDKAGEGAAADRAVSAEESDLWREVMGGVRRLPDEKRKARTPPPPPPPAPRPKAGRRPPPAMPAQPAGPPPEPPLAHGEAPGLDKRTRLRLRRGQVEIQGVIDLHGHTQVEAHRALAGFLEGAQSAGKRAVLVITGKGLAPGSGILRAAVPRWLNEPALRRMIRAFSHAQPKDGGEGALYVLLRRKR
ncbi:MAG TPA: Smr/MutS family protein [Rhodospirillales bacterium]